MRFFVLTVFLFSLGAVSGEVVIDARSDNADLASLFLSSGSLDPVFAPGTTSYSLTVSNLTAELVAVPTKAEGDATIEVRVNGGSYSPATSGAIFGPFGIGIGANTLELRVTAEDEVATKTYTVLGTRQKADQTIAFGAIPDQVATATVNLSATGGGSGNAVTFNVTNGPATLGGGNQLTFTGAGVVTVFASQEGNASHNAASPVARTFTVSKAPATVTLGGLMQTYDGSPRSASAPTDPSGKNVVITHEGSTTAPRNAGSYAVVATLDDPIFQGSDSGILLVSRAGQTLDFAMIPDQLISAALNLAASGGGSAEGIVYTVISGPGVISNGNQLRFTGEGSVTIRASQSGDLNHEDATPLERAFNVILPRPDVAVGTSLASLTGAGIYSSPSAQQFVLSSRKARPVSGLATVANRASLPGSGAAERLTVSGSPGSRFFRVDYSGATGNLTAAVISGTFETAAIDESDGELSIRVSVVPNKKKIRKWIGNRTKNRRKILANLVRAVSTTHAAASDGGLIQVQTR